MLKEDEILLSEFKKALRREGRENVIDFDDVFSLKFELQAHRFEDILAGTNRTIPPNRWSHHRVWLIKKGSGEFISGIYKFTAVKNTLVIIPARVTTSSRNWGPDVEGYILLFNVAFFLQNSFPSQHIESKKILHRSLQPYVHISDEQAAEISGLFETILRERLNSGHGNNELVALKVLEMLIMCERIFDEQLHFAENLPTIDLISRFCHLVDEHVAQQRKVSFYASELHVHPNYLNAVVKKHTGFTAKESIQNRLLLEIKYLLHSTNLSVKEISAKLGFSDPNYVSTFFTRLEKVSPTNYRASFV